jgi:hypothetical protein
MQYELVTFEQVDKAGVALQEVLNQSDNLVENGFKAEIACHQPADSLEESQLLFGAL